MNILEHFINVNEIEESIQANVGKMIMIEYKCFDIRIDHVVQ